jgi:hypothetical protein
MPDAGAPGTEVTPGMVEAGIDEIWPDPKPPAFIGALAKRVYLAMEAMRRLEAKTGVSSRHQ